MVNGSHRTSRPVKHWQTNPPKTVSSYLARSLKNPLFALLVSVCLGTDVAPSQDATWLLNPGSSLWNTDANWSPAQAPTGTAILQASNTTTITFKGQTSVDAVRFDGAAPAYTFKLSGSASLSLVGAGLVNNSVNQPSFVTTDGSLFFRAASTAANATVTNTMGGLSQFENANSANSAATITVQTPSPTGSGSTSEAVASASGGCRLSVVGGQLSDVS